MGFNKRYLTKESIQKAIKSGSIYSFLKADALIECDPWVDIFMRNYNSNPDYLTFRDHLYYDTAFSSDLSLIKKHNNYSYLKSLSNIYINLNLDPTWIDIILATDVLEMESQNSMSAEFTKLKNLCISNIENYLVINSRSKVIDSLLPNKEG